MSEHDGFIEVSTIEEAKDAWETFFGRFFSPEIPAGVDVTFDPKLLAFEPREQRDAKYNPPPVFNSKLVTAIDKDRTFHSDDFDDFLNGNIVIIPKDISLNEEGLEQVAQAIKDGDFEHESLKKEDHTFYALWLFRQNRITRQQMATILARAQIPADYPLVKTFHIFDEAGTITKEAKELWLPAVEKSWLGFGSDYTEEKKKQLLLLIAAAPKSEQIFFISKVNPNIVSPSNWSLGNALRENDAWYYTYYEKEKYDLHFSFGVNDAIQIAKCGANGAAASRAILGTVNINQVKEGVEFYSRPTAISMSMSGVEATTKGIHEYDESPMPAVTAHDVFHSKLHNTIPPRFHMMLNHMNQVIAKHTKLKWSKTMWELVDREFHAFQEQNIELDSPQAGARFFKKMLHYADKDRTFMFWDSNKSELSDDGFAVVWDMVSNSEVWKKLFKIDIDSLPEPYPELIKEMKLFKKAIGNRQEPSELLALKYRYFRVTNKTEFSKICGLLDLLSKQLILDSDKKVTAQDQKLVFGKCTHRDENNLAILKFKNLGEDELIYSASVKKLTPIFAGMRLRSLLGEKNDQAVKAELSEISAQFKSTYQGSKFSKKLLETSLDKLPSITAKLDFLEACYEDIVHSRGYKRRHLDLDRTFAFFKNPLTTSQRHHVILLKEKQNEIINNYQQENKLTTAEKKELQWCLQIRGSHLSRCNTTRFYLHDDYEMPPSAKKY